MLKQTTVTLLMAFLAACHQPIKLNPSPPPDDYLVCETLPAAPDLAPLEAYTASNGAKVYLKPDVDNRDAAIASYIIALRGAWFSCSNQLRGVAEYYKAQE